VIVTSSTRIARRAGGFEHELAIGDAFPGSEHAPQRCDESVRLVQEISEGAAACLLQAEGEHILRRDVRVDRAQLCIEYDDPRRQSIKEVGGIEMR
jgi:hypothetical protein